MGKPATDYFCINGHHVDGTCHHGFCDRDLDDEVKPCQFCGSFQIACHLEWGDDEYTQVVPQKPIGVDKNGHSLFNVKKLFKRN